MNSLKKEITHRLQTLQPSKLTIYDDSAAHAGHSGALESGGGHFNILIVAEIFTSKTLIHRQRLVYQQLEDLMPKRIHALSLKTLAPSEI